MGTQVKGRLAAWCGLVKGTVARVLDPKVGTGQAAAELVAGVVLAPVAFVVIMIRGR